MLKRALAVGVPTMLVIAASILLNTDNPVSRSYRSASGFDRANMWFQIAGLMLTVIGFWIAFVQIAKTKEAAEAARDSANVGTLRIRYNQLIILLPQLQSLEVEFDAAIKEDDSFAIERVLVRWRQVASQAAGILTHLGGDHTDTGESLQKSLETARTLKSRLSIGTKSKSLAALAAGPRTELSASTDLLAQTVGHLATRVPEGETA